MVNKITDHKLFEIQMNKSRERDIQLQPIKLYVTNHFQSGRSDYQQLIVFMLFILSNYILSVS